MTIITGIFILLVVYQLKHWLADFPLQRAFMLQKFRPDWGFLGPLAAHAGVHAAFTWLIVGFWELAHHRDSVLLPLCLAALDFTIHFTMDRLKAGPRYMGRWKALSGREYTALMALPPAKDDILRALETEAKKAVLRSNTLFWWSIGIDQAVHHITHYAIIAVLVTR